MPSKILDYYCGELIELDRSRSDLKSAPLVLVWSLNGVFLFPVVLYCSNTSRTETEVRLKRYMDLLSKYPAEYSISGVC